MHVRQHRLERFQAVHDVRHVGAITHEADAHDLAGERTEPGFNFKLAFTEQPAALYMI
jgi:hypothetical protein